MVKYLIVFVLATALLVSASVALAAPGGVKGKPVPPPDDGEYSPPPAPAQPFALRIPPAQPFV